MKYSDMLWYTLVFTIIAIGLIRYERGLTILCISVGLSLVCAIVLILAGLILPDRGEDGTHI